MVYSRAAFSNPLLFVCPLASLALLPDYHTTPDFPFTIGCYGPKNAEECEEADKECGDDYVSVEVKDPSTDSGLGVIVHPVGADNNKYDTYCSCRYTKSGTGDLGSNALVVPCGDGTDVACPGPGVTNEGRTFTMWQPMLFATLAVFHSTYCGSL